MQNMCGFNEYGKSCGGMSASKNTPVVINNVKKIK
jgi:hypothetical protein